MIRCRLTHRDIPDTHDRNGRQQLRSVCLLWAPQPLNIPAPFGMSR